MVRMAMGQHDLLDALASLGRRGLDPVQVPGVIRARVDDDGRLSAGFGDQPGVGAVQGH
jgi:hypothetical protein